MRPTVETEALKPWRQTSGAILSRLHIGCGLRSRSTARTSRVSRLGRQTVCGRVDLRATCFFPAVERPEGLAGASAALEISDSPLASFSHVFERGQG